MVSAYTPNKDIEQPANGDYDGDWDGPVNTNWETIDTALGGSITVNVVGESGTIVLAPADYRPLNVIFEGLLTANVTYELPAGVGGQWTVFNNTTGSFSLTISSAGAGRSLALVQGFRTLVVSDGTNVDLALDAPINPGGSNGQMQFNLAGFLAGSSKFTFDLTNYLFSATKVGIGTASPGTELDVKGTLRLSGASSGYIGFSPASAAGSTTYTLPAADGSNGQFLTTNGSGLLSWGGSSAGVSTFSAGTTGLTPSAATGGAVTLAGTLIVANGGTGAATLTGYVKGAGTSALTASATVPTSDLTGTLAIANGGTAAVTATAARTALATAGKLAFVEEASLETNTGRISYGTGAAPAGLDNGEIYLRYV
jgi:hypothetical protein